METLRPKQAKRSGTDAIPDALDRAIPRSSRILATESAIRWHVVARDTFEIGRDTIKIPGSSETIGIYTPERSIVDAFRLRGELGYEIGRDALRKWLRRGGKPAQLMAIANRLPRAGTPLLPGIDAFA